jgi:hypothetical protein
MKFLINYFWLKDKLKKRAWILFKSLVLNKQKKIKIEPQKLI